MQDAGATKPRKKGTAGEADRVFDRGIGSVMEVLWMEDRLWAQYHLDTIINPKMLKLRKTINGV